MAFVLRAMEKPMPRLMLFSLPLAVVLLAAGCQTPHATTAPADPLALSSLAPDFTLDNAHGGKIALSQITVTHPVLLIFYLGYSCPRCVSHLHALGDQKSDFDKTGVQILAVSPDAIADTKQSIDAYGDFPFPLLSDPAMKVAKTYGLVEGKDTLFHAAIIIDTHRKIRFAVKSSHPYDDWDALLDRLNALDDETQK
jgi:peroxiredoxin